VSSVSTTRRGSILAASILAGLGSCLLLAFFFSTATSNVFIENDTSELVTVSVCGSDPATVHPGESVNLYPPSAHPLAACVVYGGETRTYVGCLSIPRSALSGSSVVRLSTMHAGVSMSQCLSQR
jgi:hypothetical protein